MFLKVHAMSQDTHWTAIGDNITKEVWRVVECKPDIVGSDEVALLLAALFGLPPNPNATRIALECSRIDKDSAAETIQEIWRAQI